MAHPKTAPKSAPKPDPKTNPDDLTEVRYARFSLNDVTQVQDLADREDRPVSVQIRRLVRERLREISLSERRDK